MPEYKKFTDHSFRVALAEQYGVDVAIFIEDIYRWTDYNRDNEQCFHDGRYWTFNKMSAFCTRHKYWTKRQVERIINKCKEFGLVLIDHFNKDPMVRTNWYALTNLALSYYETSSDAEGKCEAPNGDMVTTKRGFDDTQTRICIEDKIDKKETKEKELTSYSPPTRPKACSQPKYQPDWFMVLWREYPRGDGKQDAMKAWDKLKPDCDLYHVMLDALDRQRTSFDWTKEGGQFIPYLCKWINKRLWENEGVRNLPPLPTDSGKWADDPEVMS